MQPKVRNRILEQGTGFICLFAVLLAFLLPVVQDYREDTRRAHCRNNLTRYAGLRSHDGNSGPVHQNDKSSDPPNSNADGLAMTPVNQTRQSSVDNLAKDHHGSESE